MRSFWKISLSFTGGFCVAITLSALAFGGDSPPKGQDTPVNSQLGPMAEVDGCTKKANQTVKILPDSDGSTQSKKSGEKSEGAK